MFDLFKGNCTRGIYDNMKTAVETIFVGKRVSTIAGSQAAYEGRFPSARSISFSCVINLL